jgi:hypothetical protein
MLDQDGNEERFECAGMFLTIKGITWPYINRPLFVVNYKSVTSEPNVLSYEGYENHQFDKSAQRGKIYILVKGNKLTYTLYSSMKERAAKPQITHMTRVRNK